jgi:hypothetical protein
MPRIVAIDLGSANVKATVWNLAGRKASFVDRWIQPVPPGEPGDLLARQMLALDALVADHPEAKGSGAIVGASFGGPALTLTHIELPFTDPKQVLTTLPFAVEEAVPFDLEDRVMAHKILSSAGTTRALVALSEEIPLRAMIQGFAARGVEPRRIFGVPELLARWEPVTEPTVALPGADVTGPRPATAVVDFGHARTRIVAVRDGVVLASNSLDLGGADLTRAIADALRCSWANAERLKCGQPVEPDPQTAAPILESDDDATDPGDVAAALTPYDELPPPGVPNLPAPIQAELERIVDRLMSELRSVLIGLEDALGVAFEQVVIGGGAARLPGLAARMQADLAVPVVWASGVGGAPVPCEFLLSDAVAEVLSGQVVTPLIDLRAGPLRWRSGFDAAQAITKYGSVLVLIFTVALGGMYAWNTWMFASELAEAQARIDQTITGALGDERVRGPIEAMASMRRRIDEAKARAQALSPGGAPPTVDMIYQLSTILPGPNDLEIDLDSVALTSRSLTFDAEVPSYAAAEQVELALKSSPRFEACTKSNEQQRRGRVLFTVTCPLSDTPADEG